ncbi:hypothetical protein E9993_14815 [Labilibacter sediminis]|nr:hypothetical protein E9993_14815 [Labilibacter sediminis]
MQVKIDFIDKIIYMYEINSRFIEVCDVKNIRQIDLRNNGGGSRPTISAVFNSRQKPNLEIMECLLKMAPDLNVRWLITGEGQMLETNETEETHLIYDEKSIKNPSIVLRELKDIFDHYEAVIEENKRLKEEIEKLK